MPSPHWLRLSQSKWLGPGSGRPGRQGSADRGSVRGRDAIAAPLPALLGGSILRRTEIQHRGSHRVPVDLAFSRYSGGTGNARFHTRRVTRGSSRLRDSRGNRPGLSRLSEARAGNQPDLPWGWAMPAEHSSTGSTGGWLQDRNLANRRQTWRDVSRLLCWVPRASRRRPQRYHDLHNLPVQWTFNFAITAAVFANKKIVTPKEAIPKETIPRETVPKETTR